MPSWNKGDFRLPTDSSEEKEDESNKSADGEKKSKADEAESEDAHSAADETQTTSSESVDPCEVGQVIANRWCIQERLGSGGFGAVYKVADTHRTSQYYALKIEAPKYAKDKLICLEVNILMLLQGKNHAIRLYSCGYWDRTSAYLVMELVGPDLSDLKHATKHNRFSLSTSIRLGIQCLDAVAEVHSIGYLHRDVKPSNFAVGDTPPSWRHVYILDYGMARRYVTNHGLHRKQRPEAGFRGTVRYASLSTLQYKDMGRRDDLWSLFYCITEFIKGRLPWREADNRRENRALKLETTPAELLDQCPPEMYQWYYYLTGLRYADTPDYAYLRRLLENVLRRRQIRTTEPYDWEISLLSGKQPTNTSLRQQQIKTV